MRGLNAKDEQSSAFGSSLPFHSSMDYNARLGQSVGVTMLPGFACPELRNSLAGLLTNHKLDHRQDLSLYLACWTADGKTAVAGRRALYM